MTADSGEAADGASTVAVQLHPERDICCVFELVTFRFEVG